MHRFVQQTRSVTKQLAVVGQNGDVALHALDSVAQLAILYGQGWLQIGQLLLAFVLSSVIGIEQEWKDKDAGLRIYATVGTSAALLTLISRYGFTDSLPLRPCG